MYFIDKRYIMCNSGVYSVELFSAFITSGDGDELLLSLPPCCPLICYRSKFIIIRILLLLSVYGRSKIIIIINNLSHLTQ